MPARPDPTKPSASPAMLATMRAWRATHRTATFAEIEVEAMRQVATLRTDLIAAALEADATAPAPPCPLCGRDMGRNGTRTRTIITSQQEPVTLTGHRYRCSVCGIELSPPR